MQTNFVTKKKSFNEDEEKQQMRESLLLKGLELKLKIHLVITHEKYDTE